MQYSTILKSPVITEKALQNTNQSRYSFMVDTRANKNQIKQAIAAQYGVKIVSINTTSKKPLSKNNLRTRRTSTIPACKKAIVTLQSGQTIKEFEVKS